MDFPKGERVGIVDVPGHEKFVKNMLAGVAGMDMVMLVVAADEGIMPQTVEHLDILSILGVRCGVIVITKQTRQIRSLQSWWRRTSGNWLRERSWRMRP